MKSPASLTAAKCRNGQRFKIGAHDLNHSKNIGHHNRARLKRSTQRQIKRASLLPACFHSQRKRHPVGAGEFFKIQRPLNRPKPEFFSPPKGALAWSATLMPLICVMPASSWANSRRRVPDCGYKQRRTGRSACCWPAPAHAPHFPPAE